MKFGFGYIPAFTESSVRALIFVPVYTPIYVVKFVIPATSSTLPMVSNSTCPLLVQVQANQANCTPEPPLSKVVVP